MEVHRKKYNKKFIHMKDLFIEQVNIKLVFYNFFHKKKSRWILNDSSMYISNELKTTAIFHIFHFLIRGIQQISHWTITTALPRRYHTR